MSEGGPERRRSARRLAASVAPEVNARHLPKRGKVTASFAMQPYQFTAHMFYLTKATNALPNQGRDIANHDEDDCRRSQVGHANSTETKQTPFRTLTAAMDDGLEYVDDNELLDLNLADDNEDGDGLVYDSDQGSDRRPLAGFAEDSEGGESSDESTVGVFSAFVALLDVLFLEIHR